MENQNRTKTPRTHEQIKRIFQYVGFGCLAAGGICTLVGMISFFGAFASPYPPRFFFLAFIGLPLLGIGGIVLGFGYHREILRYQKNESIPVLREAGREISPAVRDIAAAVGEGLRTAAPSQMQTCTHCGAQVAPGTKFCSMCGEALPLTCVHCGARLPADAQYCPACGKKV